MPGPLNIFHREYAHDTHRAAETFATALSNMYAAIAEIEHQNSVGVPKKKPAFKKAKRRLLSATRHLDEAADLMAHMHSVASRWDIDDQPRFAELIRQFSELSGSVLLGDRMMIDILVDELRALAELTRWIKVIPRDHEHQSHLIGRVLRKSMHCQQLCLLAAQISLVTYPRSESGLLRSEIRPPRISPDPIST